MRQRQIQIHLFLLIYIDVTSNSHILICNAEVCKILLYLSVECLPDVAEDGLFRLVFAYRYMVNFQVTWSRVSCTM